MMMPHPPLTDLDRALWNLNCAERLARDRALHLIFLYSAALGGLVVYLAMRFL